MKTMKNTITLSILALLLTVLGSNISFAGKGGKKVNVESASPGSVVQTQEEDVTILGSGFAFSYGCSQLLQVLCFLVH